MPNFSSLARLEVPEKFVWVVVGGVCKVIFMSNPTVVLCCVGVGVLTKRFFFYGLILYYVGNVLIKLDCPKGILTA